MLRGRLGEGGQGVVYLGADEQGLLYAIKWLRPHLAGDATAAERFAREAAVAQRVAPFCTARCVATGVQDERPFIVSEYVDGPSLYQVVTERGPRADAALHRLAIGTVTALAAIHQAGIVHRDFSPANVLLADDGPRVVDFGIARALDMTSITSTPIGTPSYMSPEQILGHPAGPPADMFSWACTMIFAATGRPPFAGDSVPTVIHRVLHAEADLSGLGGPLRDLVAACLAKDPARRPTAEQAIMGLVGQPVPLHEAASVAGGQGPAAAGGRQAPQGAPGFHAPQGAPGFQAPQGQAWSDPGAPPHGHPPASGPQQPWTPGGSGQQPWTPGGSGQQPWIPGGSGPQQPQTPAGPNQPWGAQPPVPGQSGTVPQQPWATPQAASQQPWAPPHGAPGTAQPYPQPKRRGPLIAGIAAGLAVIATAVAVVVALRGSSGTPPVTTPTGGQAATSQTTPTTSPTPTPSTTPIATTGLATVRLPDTGVTIYEHPTDAVRLTTYTVWDEGLKASVYYPRDSLTGSFTRQDDFWESLLSPDGRYLAARAKRFTETGYDSVRITDKTSGESFVIETSRQPLSAYIEAWSRDSSRVLVNVGKPAGEGWQSTGFAIVDVAARRASVVTLRESALRDVRYGFDHEDKGVVALAPGSTQQAMRFFTETGERVRRVPNVGAAIPSFLFSPSGRLFQTTCAGLDSGNHCVYDTATGREVRRFESSCTGDSWWYDEAHLICWARLSQGDSSEIVVIDFTGARVRRLATVPAGDNRVTVFYTHR